MLPRVLLNVKKVQKNLFHSNIGLQFLSFVKGYSCNVKIRQKSSLDQTRVKGVLVVGLQNPSAK